MKKMIAVFLCTALLLAGCQTKTGFHYPAIAEREIGQKYNEGAMYAYSMLRWDEKIYTSAYDYSTTDKSEIPLNALLGEELGAVWGNHTVFWSTDSSELLEATVEGTLYEVKGYGEDFRVCVYYEFSQPLMDTVYGLKVFDQLNGITLHKGSELYTDRLCLDRATGAAAESGPLSLEDTAVRDFMTALNDGVFLDPTAESFPDLAWEDGERLFFTDPCGLVTEVVVYEDGYVCPWPNFRNTGCKMVLAVDAGKCQAVIGAIRQSQENPM